MITLKQAQAIYTALAALQDAGITGTQIRVVNNGTASTVWTDNGTAANGRYFMRRLPVD